MRFDRKAVLTVVHIFGLWAAFAAHPLLDVLGRAPDFFVAHRADPVEILAVLAALLVVPPAILAGVVSIAAAMGRHAWSAAAGVTLAVLLAAPVMQALVKAGTATWAGAVMPSAALGISGALLYFRFPLVRGAVTLVSAASLVVPLMFVARQGIRELLRPVAPATLSPLERGAPQRSAVPVVLIVFDEMPLVSLLDARRTIDARRLPHLAALAADGVWFRNATTVSDYTPWAVPAILTGRFPAAGKPPAFRAHPETLFTFMSRTHRLEVVESLTRLCPPALCHEIQRSSADRLRGIGRDVAVVAGHVFLTPDLRTRLDVPELSARWAPLPDTPGAPDTSAARPVRRGRGYGDRRVLIDNFISRLRPEPDRPGFYFMHPPLPHEPWVLLPTGQRNATRAPLPSAVYASAPIDEWEVVQNQQRHLLQVGYIDHALGRMVERLKANGLYDRALVVVTADHGVAIASGRHARNFTPETAGEIMRIPLIVKFPGGMEVPPHLGAVLANGQRVSDRNVETIDIAPTIAAVIGVRLPWRTDGSSLLDAAAPTRAAKQIWFDRATTIHRYGAEGPSIDAVLRQRLETFGEGNVYSIPLLPRLSALLGRRVDDVPQTEDVVAGALFAHEYAGFSPEADAAPFDVAGVLRDGADASSPRYLAVAVNGVIRGVTRTWTSRPGWLATPPPEVWRAGRNEIGAYLVVERNGKMALTRVHTAPPPGLNLIGGDAARYWSVRQNGFYRHEGKGAGFRWTRDIASVSIPLHGQTPTGVRLSIARAIQPTTQLAVTVNGCRVYEGSVPRSWEVTLSLGRCGVQADELRIELKSTAIRPPKDGRLLGVAVRSISLEFPSP